MHNINPKRKTVGNKLFNNWMITVNGISTPGIIHVKLFIIWNKMIINGIIYRLETKYRSLMVTFVSMIKHNIQDNFDASFMQSLNHITEFIEMVALMRLAAVPRYRSKKAYRAIPPIVRKLRSIGHCFEYLLCIKLKNRKKFNCCHSKLFEIRDLLNHSTKCTGMFDSA